MEIIRKPTFLGALACGFASYWSITLLTTWGVTFFVKSLGYAPTAAGWCISLVAGIGAIIGLGGGWFSQALSSRGVSSRLSRGMLIATVTLISGISFVLMTILHVPAVQFVLFVIAFSVTSTVYTPCYAMIAEICPPDRRGGAVGLFTSLMTSAGIISPAIMGVAVQYWGGYDIGFLVSGILAIGGSIVGLLVLNPDRDRYQVTNA